MLTHAHFDHMGGVDEVRKAAGCPVYIHDLEADWLTDAKQEWLRQMAGCYGSRLPRIPLNMRWRKARSWSCLGISFRVMHTPGHSPGSVSLLCDEHLFCGDVLFKMSVGRTDLPGGRERDLYDSIRRNCISLIRMFLYIPVTAAQTTIGYEMANNPIRASLIGSKKGFYAVMRGIRSG